MKKNFVKVMLLGALAFSTTVSFVGCKDYDDDIDGLNESLAATNSDLSSKATALEASIASLKSAQTDITAAIAKATDDAQKAALQAKSDAIASSLASMNSIKAELTTLINANTTNISTLNQKAKGIEEKLTSLESTLSEIQKMLVGYSDLVETVGKLQSAMTRIDQIDNSLGTLSAEVEQALKDIAAQKISLETQQKAITNLEALTGDHSEELSKIQVEIKTLIANLETQKAALDKAATKDELAAIQASVDANKSSIETLKNEIDGKINILKDLFYSMITNINLVSGSAHQDLTAIKCVKDLIFGEGLNGEIKFKKDQVYTVPGSNIIIQVSPSTSNVTANMLSILRSDGESIDKYITTEVKAYNDALTRGESKGGLWTISTQLKSDYNKTEFTKSTVEPTTQRPYLFAIAVKETVKGTTETDRIVASPYRLSFSDGGSAYTTLQELNSTTINEVSVNNGTIPVEIGKPFTIQVKSNDANAKVYACYITLDGNDDQKIVWRSYGLSGYDVVKVGSELSLTVANEVANGKTVNFTIHAVDFAGNSVVTKGFSIICGKQNSGSPSFSTKLISETADASNIYNMPKAVKMSANLATTDDDAKNLVGGSYVVNIKDMNAIATFYKEDLSTILDLSSASNIKAIAAIKLDNIDLAKITDNGSITGSINFKNASGLQILTVPVTLSKDMPAFPEAFSAKTGMLNDGIITVFPTYNAGKSTFEYKKIFNMIDDSNSGYFTFGTIADLGSKVDFSNSDIIQIDNSLVGKTKAAIDMKVSYNYGKISSATANNYWKPLWGTKFAIKFASLPEESGISLEKAFTITYPAADKTLVHHSVKDDGGYIITKADDKNTTSMKLIPGTYDIQSISLKTISGANIENEYYKPILNNDGSITFRKNSDSAVINNNVATTLHITIKDVFGNTINKEISFTVVKP